MYIYPNDLKAKPTLWLWALRDVAVIGVCLVLSVLALMVACDTFEQALQKVMELGGQQFLQDMFSAKPEQPLYESPASSDIGMQAMW